MKTPLSQPTRTGSMEAVLCWSRRASWLRPSRTISYTASTIAAPSITGSSERADMMS